MDDFRIAHSGSREGDFIAMLVDSEDPVKDPERPWDHLKRRDDWERPNDALDEQVFLMTTCMETWVVADWVTLRKHFGQELQESARLPVQGLEERSRQDVYACLVRATSKCTKGYAKGRASFEVLAEVDPGALRALPSFVRLERILKERLPGG